LNLLIIAPNIDPPWTEGRKKLVSDLAQHLQKHFAVRMLTTGIKKGEITSPCLGYCVGAQWKWKQLIALCRAIDKAITEWSPDVVLHFPFGTFDGLRGIANMRSIRCIDRKCAKRKLRCLTILYSITTISLKRLKHDVHEPVIASRKDWKGLTITMGVDLTDSLYLSPQLSGKPTVLFMAGIQERKKRALQYVLKERGLEDIVKASPKLAMAGVRIIVAIPFLHDLKLRSQLRRYFIRNCPNIELDLRSDILVPQIFKEADLFLFPYRVELTQFVPTSILEGMAAGVPVVLSDLEMLSEFANYGRTAYTFRPGDYKDLGDVAVAALGNKIERRRIALAAREYALKEWSLDKTVDDLIEILYQ